MQTAMPAQPPTTPMPAQQAADASVLNGVLAPAKPKAPAVQAPAKPKAPAVQAPAKPKALAKPKAPAAPPAAPAKPATAGRMHNQALARALVNALAATFTKANGYTPQDQEKVANWVKHLPTGDPTGKTDGAGPNRYWPKGFNRPTQSDWR